MRLIDADALEPDADYDDGEFWAVSMTQIENAPTIEPKKEIPLIEKREWIKGYENRWYRKKFYCASCGIKIKTESWNEKRCFGEGTILQDNDIPNFCPNCGARLEVNK